MDMVLKSKVFGIRLPEFESWLSQLPLTNEFQPWIPQLLLCCNIFFFFLRMFAAWSTVLEAKQSTSSLLWGEPNLQRNELRAGGAVGPSVMLQYSFYEIEGLLYRVSAKMEQNNPWKGTNAWHILMLNKY